MDCAGVCCARPRHVWFYFHFSQILITDVFYSRWVEKGSNNEGKCSFIINQITLSSSYPWRIWEAP
jgi:hypothetical protein